MANSAYQTAPAFIKETAPVTLTANKVKDIRIDGKATAIYCKYTGNATNVIDIVYIPYGKDPNFSNIKSISGIAPGTFTNILADYVLGDYSSARGLDYLQEIADTQQASTLTASGVGAVDFVEGTYTVDMDITDDGTPGTVRGSYSFKIIVNSSNTITSIKIQEMALGLESGDDVILPSNTLSSSHAQVVFNLSGQTEVPSSTVVPITGTTGDIQAYR